MFLIFSFLFILLDSTFVPPKLHSEGWSPQYWTCDKRNHVEKLKFCDPTLSNEARVADLLSYFSLDMKLSHFVLNMQAIEEINVKGDKDIFLPPKKKPKTLDLKSIRNFFLKRYFASNYFGIPKFAVLNLPPKLILCMRFLLGCDMYSGY